MDVQAANSGTYPVSPITHLEVDSDKYRNYGRIKGAVYFGWRTDLCFPFDSTNYFYELPSLISFQETLRKKGVTNDSKIVIYGDSHWSNRIAVRAYFVLKYFGHKNVQILNGGIEAWQAAGSDYNTNHYFENNAINYNDFLTSESNRVWSEYYIDPTFENKDWIVDLDFVDKNWDSKRHILVDSRPYGMYFGTQAAVAIHNGTPANRRGHIMGAVSAQWADYLGPEIVVQSSDPDVSYKYRR